MKMDGEEMKRIGYDESRSSAGVSERIVEQK